GAAVYRGGPGARAGRDHAQAVQLPARRAGHRREPAGLRRDRLVRRVGAGRHAPADSRAGQRRHQCHAADRGGAQDAHHAGRRARRLDPAGLRRVCRGGNAALAEADPRNEGGAAMSAPAPRRLADCLADWARRAPRQPALSDAHVDWTYAELAQRVDEAEAFLRGLGLAPGERVMLVGENGATLAALILAAGRLDLWAVLENARRAPLEVDTVARLAQPRRLLYALDTSPDAAAHARRHGA